MRRTNMILAGIAVMFLIGILILVAAHQQEVDHRDIIAHVDDTLLRHGGR